MKLRFSLPGAATFTAAVYVTMVVLAIWTVWGLSSRSLSAAEGSEGGGEDALDASNVAAFFENYCMECHAGVDAHADVRLDSLESDSDAFLKPGSAAVWHEVRDSLNLGEMPPKRAFQPPSADKIKVAAWIASQLKAAQREARSAGGEVVIRRMTRSEYANTVRDLTGLEWTIGEAPNEVLPDDTPVHDLKKNSLGLTLDASLMSGYVDLAQTIARRVIAVTDEPEFPNRVRRSPWTAMGQFAKRVERDLAYDISAEGHAIIRSGKSHNLHQWFDQLQYGDQPGVVHPVKGKYVARFRAWSVNASDGAPVTLHVQNKGATSVAMPNWKLVLSDQPQVFEFSYFVDAVQAPGSGAWVLSVENGTRMVNEDTLPGRQLGLRKVRRNNSQKASRKMLREQALKTARRTMEGFFHHNIPAPEILTLQQHPYAVIEWAEIEGPVEPWPSLVQKEYFTAEDGTFDLSGGISRFMQRAFRRPVTDSEVAQITALADAEAQRMGDVRWGARAAVTSVLSSPHFLYVSAPDLTLDASGDNQVIGPYELASRLSYFLWSSMPDDRLFQLAASGQILDPAVRQAEVDRMLDDPRSEALTKEFATQWLRVDQFNQFEPSAEIYGKVEPKLLRDMERESLAFFDEVLHGGRPVSSFIRSDFTMLNERLARFYGVKGVTGDEFRPVERTPDSRRGGLLTMAGVHRYGSDGVRTKPVARGVYVKEVLLNDPPNPPPPNAGEIQPNDPGKSLTVKDRLIAHQQIETCAACHRTIDPYGLALENFDVMGQWRDVQNGENFNRRNAPPIDPSGEFTNGDRFETFDEFIDLMAKDHQRFRHALAEKFASYALGREILTHEEGLIDDVAQRTLQDGDRMRTMLRELVASPIFERP